MSVFSKGPTADVDGDTRSALLGGALYGLNGVRRQKVLPGWRRNNNAGECPGTLAY